MVFCKDKQLVGVILESLERWQRHFQEVFEAEEAEEEIKGEINVEVNYIGNPPDNKEIMESIKAFKNNKAPEESSVFVKMLKIGELISKKIYTR